jgi:hypothetical protein
VAALASSGWSYWRGAHLHRLGDLAVVAAVTACRVQPGHKFSERAGDGGAEPIVELHRKSGLAHAPLLPGVQARVQQIDELLGHDGVCAGHLARAVQQLAEVAVDEVSLLFVRVAYAKDLVPAVLLFELGRVRRLRERVASVSARDDRLARLPQTVLELLDLFALRLNRPVPRAAQRKGGALGGII